MRKLVLIVSDFDCLDNENISYAAKEIVLIEDLGMKEERVRFFHRRFQSKLLTLGRILKEEKRAEIHVIFQKRIKPKKVVKLINRISKKMENGILVFSSTLV